MYRKSPKNRQNKTVQTNLESRTVVAMIRIYCRAHHDAGAKQCNECIELLSYTQDQITHCTFGKNKPVCNHCCVHCFSPEMRNRIQIVMRYAGPRMLWHHPILAIRHLLRAQKSQKPTTNHDR